MDERTIRILQDYRDKCYVSDILCTMNCDYYKKIRQIINIPLILSSTVMSIMNSSTFPENDLKIANITLNACTSLLLSLIGNFRIVEKAGSFRNSGLKFNKLCHLIEDKLMNQDEVTNETIRQIILDYDNIYESLEFSYSTRSKDKCKKRFVGKRTLPNVLNCEIDFSNANVPRSTPSVSKVPHDLFCAKEPVVFANPNKPVTVDINIEE
jgi:hypothetical protein